ncbi:hypothetical protein COU78_03215 [Candidatus Peregrinibacteria bacterium CG10_big_fil_rev_8_21_14_0_10_49_24]|nr:MAG: hypothetical protein COV83_05035 [Candidatus Peregrinibacteria bacterium CG11_big_fil_rev_8_21_14_0_20_49_14]PIR51135.1 MAG: hypothetical protein COU78_03215 [Candidatus Peregrinibacteria bacterium CG10_big_fil_rev_8_21_14_0_10_49_24]
MNKTFLVVTLLFPLLLAGCGSDEEETELQSSTSRGGVAAVTITSTRVQNAMQQIRPSAPLGMFISSYLAQGAFVSVKAAMLGIEAQRTLLIGQSLPATSETFLLLQEFGTVLQVDIADTLNRSDNRGKTLDEYLGSLRSVGSIALRKQKELDQQVETLKTEKKDRRTVVRELESELRSTLKNEDYGRSAGIQEQLTEAESNLAQTEARLNQTEDILKRFEEMLKIAEERLRAIEKNREVLIAGLKVLEVPGIENLGILDEKKPFRRSSNSEDSSNIFGTEYIRE